MSAPDLNKAELYLRKDLIEWGNYLTEEYSEVARDCIIIIEELREARKELNMWRENVRHPEHMKERLKYVYEMSERVKNKPAMKEYIKEAFLLEWVLTPGKEGKE